MIKRDEKRGHVVLILMPRTDSTRICPATDDATSYVQERLRHVGAYGAVIWVTEIGCCSRNTSATIWRRRLDSVVE